jgi:hypothetical protein
MFRRYHEFPISSGNQTNAGVNPQWEMVRGKVISSINSSDVFRGNEILEVSVVNASLMDAPSILLGRQQIQLQPGQQFPIRFQFYSSGPIPKFSSEFLIPCLSHTNCNHKSSRIIRILEF